MSLKLDDGGHFARGQVARYQEVIDDQIHKIPIQDQQEAKIIKQALTIISQGQSNYLDPFGEASGPHINDLKERIEELADVVTHPEEMLDPKFDPDQTQRLGEIFRERVGFQASKIDKADQLEQSVKDREAERTAATAYRETIKDKAPPPPDSEAHTVSYEAMLRAQWGEPRPDTRSPLPNWLFEMATPIQQHAFNASASLMEQRNPLLYIPFPAEPPENIATRRAYLSIATGFHYYLDQFGLTVDQALELGAHRMNSYIISSNLRTLALNVLSEGVCSFSDLNRLSIDVLASISRPFQQSAFCMLLKHLSIDAVIQLDPQKLNLLINMIGNTLFLAERNLLTPCLRLSDGDLSKVLSNAAHVVRNIRIGHASLEEQAAFLRKPGAEEIIQDAAMTEFRAAGVSFDQLLALPKALRQQFKNDGSCYTYQQLHKSGETWESFLARYPQT